jgi:hypothetical protein
VKKGHIPPMLKLSEISLKRAPIFFPILTFNKENPVKPSFSVPVENTLNYHSVCQNKADFHPSQCLPMALQPRLFSLPIITHLNYETLPERECEGHFFPTRLIIKQTLNPNEKEEFEMSFSQVPAKILLLDCTMKTIIP